MTAIHESGNHLTGPLDQEIANELLGSGSMLDTESSRRLHDRVVAGAAERQLLDVAYRTVDTPIGPLLVAASAAGILRIAFGPEDHEAVLSNLASEVSPRVLFAPAALDDIARQLDEYFTRRRRTFDLTVDLRLARGFRRRALEQLQKVPYGTTVSYAGLAAATGSPAAVRATGSACARNPVPIVVPCHRVVRSDGSIGQYGGGVSVKAALLELESAGSSEWVQTG